MLRLPVKIGVTPWPSDRMRFLFVEPVSWTSKPSCVVVDDLLVERQLEALVARRADVLEQVVIVPPIEGASGR